ncbi:RING-H2 finger protein ATL18-like [Cynara cardunculus var. scolymus]|uniref:RING-H2 finger protein ATL18-like n=1 Tax=Cynara cardunculus var. scolymus TaxID=59895 RepID=UPI000D6296FC|nr:RING-H2 finger protein ATL18-like [Cynara cardunculus var. scolymus]
MAIIFYICLLLPVLRIKSDLLNLLKDSVSDLLGYGGVNPRLHEEDVCLVDLPIIRFDDLQNRRHRSVDRMCFICSADYHKEDVLCQLSRCGHVFHSDCVGKLLHRRQTSCPFCHSPVFSGIPKVAC